MNLAASFLSRRGVCLCLGLYFCGGAMDSGAAAAEAEPFPELAMRYAEQARPLVERYCLSCHDTDTRKGELDLERFGSLDAVRADPAVWQQVVAQMESREMPPSDKQQPTPEERSQLLAWVKRYLEAEALAGAGDPGPVVLRRLSNAEYTYSVRDLTEVPSLAPAAEFPVDGAAGEGFTNTGDALSMSPALFEKYLDAGKEIAAHAVLTPDGFRFSGSDSRADWSNALVEEIRSFYQEILQTGAIDFGYRAQVGAVNPQDNSEGRLDYARYLEATIRHREELRTDAERAGALARGEGLNAKYFTILARTLTAPEDSGDILLNQLRSRWKTARTGEGAVLAEWIRRWQDRLWKFNPVGHLGGTAFDWQEAVDPLAPQRDLQIKLEAAAGESSILVTLTAGTAGDGAVGDVVRWENPRLVRPGSPPLPLKDVPSLSSGFERFRALAFSQVARILEVAFEARQSGRATGIDALAASRGLDGNALRLFLNYLGVDASDALEIDGYLTLRKENVGNQSAIAGWGMEGQSDLSFLSNRSDTVWHIPGEAPPHRIVVHPMPKRWIAAGWKSPLQGRVEIAAQVRDRHVCGNGVRWTLLQRRGAQERVLRSGVVSSGATAEIEPLESADIRPGDLISLVIDARDGNHACDLTEIELTVSERGGEERRWSLSEDCADSILAGNPHADRHGNPGIWHFYSGAPAEGELAWKAYPENSILARWSEAKSRDAALGSRLQALLTAPLPDGDALSEADGELVEQLKRADGPLFSRARLADLVAYGEPDPASENDFGLSRDRFTGAGHLTVQAPSTLQFRLPAAFFAGAQFVVSGGLAPSAERENGSVQLALTLGASTASEEAVPGIPLTVIPRGAAEGRVLRSYAGFRDLFPAALCYARVVPIDEVVTLVLYHREDDQLVRLLLNDAQHARIDRLWDELTYVSRDAFRMVVALEQILEFATQDADPRKFTPMLEPVARNAAALESRLQSTEPAHVSALVAFAARAYRRPLSQAEAHGLRALYHSLRSEDLSHEEAFRLTLARVFAAPAFLYRAEQPVPGADQGPVSSWEQASRLSYFLWSSTPDAALARAAEAGDLRDPDKLLEQAMRLLGDGRVRRLAEQFACQWLHVRDFDQFDEKNERLYPEFVGLRGAMYEETLRFFTDLFQKGGSILSILDADHTFVNPELAAFYGIAAADQAGWQRVEGWRQRGRGGILGMATTLAKQSGASRTSPILRGNWVSETLLGEKLPKPPSGVPTLPDTAPVGLSTRELIERHSSEPACAKCHARIDPYGFALESFDAIGRARGEGRPADTRTRLLDGTELEGIAGLRRYLTEDRRETFVRQFCRKLLGYALGRSVRLSDEPLLDEMWDQLGKTEYSFHTALAGIVRSRQFREIRGEAAGRRDRVDGVGDSP